MVRPKGGFLLLLGVGFPPFLVLIGGGRKGKRERRKGGSAPPNSDWAWGGAPPPGLLLLFPLKPIKVIYLPGGSDNLPVLRYYPDLTRNHSGVQI